ncbi:MAG: hypothetical protein K0S36_1711 [Nitrosospira multiformis]|nr:hypothetical protein [Nitrosospira multiformis]
MRHANGNPKREDERSAGASGAGGEMTGNGIAPGNQPGISLNKWWSCLMVLTANQKKAERR